MLRRGRHRSVRYSTAETAPELRLPIACLTEYRATSPEQAPAPLLGIPLGLRGKRSTSVGASLGDTDIRASGSPQLRARRSASAPPHPAQLDPSAERLMVAVLGMPSPALPSGEPLPSKWSWWERAMAAASVKSDRPVRNS